MVASSNGSPLLFVFGFLAIFSSYGFGLKPASAALGNLHHKTSKASQSERMGCPLRATFISPFEPKWFFQITLDMSTPFEN
jgi:hypothetical protein